MADDVTTIAVPSAAETHLEPQKVLNGMTREQRKEWQLTGKIPDQPKAAPTPAQSSEADTEKVDAESAPASEAGPSQEKSPKRDNAETRLKELLADLKKAGLSPAELKTFKREAQKAETKAEPSPAPERIEPPKLQPVQKLEAPKKPNVKDFDDYEKYEAAKDKYYEDFTEFKKKEAIAEFQRQAAEQYQAQQVQKELTAGRERYKDFDQVAGPALQTLITDTAIPEIVRETIGRSPVFVDLLYAIGGKEEYAKDFFATAKADPWAAVRKAIVLEQLVLEELGKQKEAKPNGAEPERGPDGKFLPTNSSPEKTVTTAKRPPVEVGGKGTAPTDPVAAAVQRGDVRSYIREMNSREMAARKG